VPAIDTNGFADALIVGSRGGTDPLGTLGVTDPRPNATMVTSAPGCAWMVAILPFDG
jgi:hypothetical protein